jgi:hypothetical protein
MSLRPKRERRKGRLWPRIHLYRLMPARLVCLRRKHQGWSSWNGMAQESRKLRVKTRNRPFQMPKNMGHQESRLSCFERRTCQSVGDAREFLVTNGGLAVWWMKAYVVGERIAVRSSALPPTKKSETPTEPVNGLQRTSHHSDSLDATQLHTSQMPMTVTPFSRCIGCHT